MEMSTEKVVSAAEAAFSASLNRLMELLRIPSISTDPAYAEDCAKAAEWVVRELSAMGFAASSRKTPGRPMVVAHYTPKSATAKTPHALFYGHYDVQPVDPIALWHTKPFEPVLKKGDDGVERIYGRAS